MRVAFTVRSYVDFKIVTHSISHLLFFNDTATPAIYTLSLHDALPIFIPLLRLMNVRTLTIGTLPASAAEARNEDRKSTRLNSSHRCISYAVFCLKKKNLTSDTFLRSLKRIGSFT